MSTECRAKDPIACRYHGQEKLIDFLFDLNKRRQGFGRDEFNGAGEESVRQIVFEMALMDHPIKNVSQLAQAYKDRKLPGLAGYFNVGAAVQEIAYRYDPQKADIPEPNLLAIDTDTATRDQQVNRIYAQYVLENGSYEEDDYGLSSNYLGHHFGLYGCEVAAVHSVSQRRAAESDFYTTTIIARVSCACGRVKNGSYTVATNTEDLVNYVFDHATK